MKKSQEFKQEQDNYIIKTSHDLAPALKRMERIREQGITTMGGNTDSRFVGSIPNVLIEDWCKEAGVKWDDIDARGEVVKRKILSGDFDKFRTDWKKSY